MRRTIYADESTFGQQNSVHGAGMLVVDGTLDQSVVSDALGALSADPDRHLQPAKTMDDSTLARGYFHASFDSKNAHSHLVTSIRQRVDGMFSCDFVDSQRGGGMDRSVESLYRASALLGSVGALDTRDPVRFVFAQREGLSSSGLESWNQERERSLAGSLSELPFAPAFFPPVDLVLAPASEPGLQCADFLLWATLRAESGDGRWLERAGAPLRFRGAPDSQRWFTHDLKLGKGLRDAEAGYDVTDYPVTGEGQLQADELINALREVWDVVEYRASNGLPERLSSADRDVKRAAELRNGALELYLESLALAYIKLFDTEPLIRPEMSRRQKGWMLMVRRHLALMLRTDLISSRLMLNWLHAQDVLIRAAK
ncbi:MAG TPA: hypothetical protein VF006_00220 [Longimicrobium sp.]